MPILFWLRELRKQRLRKGWVRPGPVLAGSGLLVLAALLTLSVVTVMKLPAATDREQQAAQSAPATVPVLPAALADKTAQQGDIDPEADQAVRPVLRSAADPLLGFGWQLHPLYRDWRFHPGVDIAGVEGQPVLSIGTGRVEKVFRDERYGLMVVIAGDGYTTIYGALADTSVEPGQRVKKGVIIGSVGQAPDEPYRHFHLVVKKGESFVNPLGQ